MGKASRTKAERRRAPVPPVGAQRPRFDRRLLVGAAVVAALVVAGAIAAAVALSGGSPPAPTSKPIAQSGLAGLQTGPAPWGRDGARLRDRLDALGLPALEQEGSVLHIHQHLDVFVNGKQEPVPAGIGIPDGNQYISTIHTHDGSGIIHVESPTKEDFTLGQFFAIWGVRLTPTAVGGYHDYALYVDGKRHAGNAASLVLRNHDELALVVGKAPATIPSSYRWPPGY